MVAIKRVYEPATPEDGERILVDRLWPRGVSRDAASIAEWARDVAPSDALRRWYGKDPTKWSEFRRRYRAELAAQRPLLEALAARGRRGRVTLLYAKADPVHNNAAVLADVLRRLASPGKRRRGAPASPSSRARSVRASRRK